MSIRLSPQAQKLFGVGEKITPSELIRALLKAPVDLLFFGGIGTYVRASDESDDAAGDRANDSIRVNGAEKDRFRTNGMIFDAPTYIAEVSKYCTIEPGDVMWMGTDGLPQNIKPGTRMATVPVPAADMQPLLDYLEAILLRMSLPADQNQ